MATPQRKVLPLDIKSEVSLLVHNNTETFVLDSTEPEKNEVVSITAPHSKLKPHQIQTSLCTSVMPEKFILSPYDLTEEYMDFTRHKGFMNDLSIAVLSSFTILLAFWWYFYFEAYDSDYQEYIKWMILVNNALTLLLLYMRYSLQYDILVTKLEVQKKGSCLCMTSLWSKMLIEMIIASISFPPYIDITLTIDNEWETTDYKLDHFILILILMRVYQIPRVIKNVGGFTTNRSQRMAWLAGVEFDFWYIIKLLYHSLPAAPLVALIFVFWLGWAVNVLEPNPNLTMIDSVWEKFWLIVATITSLGFGEISVTTTIARVALSIGALAGNVIAAALMVIGRENLTLDGSQLNAYNKLEVALKHDNRVRKLANPAARLIQTKFHIYQFRSRKPGLKIPHIFQRMSLNSQFQRDIQQFKFQRQQLPVVLTQETSDIANQLEETQLEKVHELGNRIKSFRHESVNLKEFWECEFHHEEITEKIRYNSLLLTQIMTQASTKLRSIQLNYLKHKLQGIIKKPSIESQEPEAEQSDSDRIPAIVLGTGLQLFKGAEAPSRHISSYKKRNVRESDANIKHLMKKKLKESVESFAYDW